MLKSILFTLISLVAALPAVAQKPEPALTATMIKEALKRPPRGKKAESLATRIRDLYGNRDMNGSIVPIHEDKGMFDIAFAIEVIGTADTPKLVMETKSPEITLNRIGETGMYAAVTTQAEGFAARFHFEIGDKKLPSKQIEVFRAHPDSLERAGVPKGAVKQLPTWNSKVFEGTHRDWWIYVPAQYKADTPACVMIFQDGGGYTGSTAKVFDNLIAKGDMPVTIGIFINPGAFADGRSNRSYEYDTLSNEYVRMLLEEILPEVEKTYNLRHDANSRAIAGISSGGICAFTAAWERPDAFGKVLSWVGSFTGIAARLDEQGRLVRPGGNNYPVLIRKTPKKSIRVFLQDGENDLDNEHGSWPLANHEMARSLAHEGYDYKFVMGNGFHSAEHGRAIMPDSLRWLWRDYKP